METTVKKVYKNKMLKQNTIASWLCKTDQRLFKFLFRNFIPPPLIQTDIGRLKNKGDND